MDALISSVNKKIVVLIILFLTLLFIPFNNTFGQLTLSGKISDPNFNPVNNATVEIFDQIDTLKNYTAITDASGYFLISNITNIEIPISRIPNEYLVIRNYPNPFNPSTIIYFEIPKAGNIGIKIFDILGREVRSLFSGFHNAGVDQINWDGKNNFNQPVSAGIYLCQLKTKDHFNVHKMVFLDGGTSSSVGISYNKLSNQNIQKPTKVDARFNFTVKVTGDSLDATYFRNLSCTKDTTLNLIVSKIIQTKTIGLDGGIVGNDDFKLTIPTGAFDGNYKISFIKIEDDGTFGENTVTPSFRLSGIPKNYSKPLKIIAKYHGELSEESYLGVGRMSYDDISADSSIGYSLYSATDSTEYLVSEIVPFSHNKLTKSSGNFSDNDAFDIFLKLLSHYNTIKSAHFTMKLPSNINLQTTQKVLEIFEDSYSIIYEALEMPYVEAVREIFIQYLHKDPSKVVDPVRISRFQEKQSEGGYVDKMNFEVSQDHLESQKFNDIQVDAVRKIFQIDIFAAGNRTWGDYSIFYWLEDLVTDDPDYNYPKQNYANNFLVNGMEPFNGIALNGVGNLANLTNHGIGMSVMIKYLTQSSSFGLNGIGNMYKYQVGETWINGLLNTVDSPFEVWWPDFFRFYIKGDIFELPNYYFINRAHDEWNIDSEEDVSKTFTSAEVGTYQDLSAKIFKINFNYTEFDNSQDLIFELKNLDNNTDLALLLFSVQDGKPKYLQTSNSKTLKIDDIKSLIDKNETQFLAIVVNNDFTTEDYLGQSNINLTAEVTPKELPPACSFDPSLYDQCKISLWVLAEKETTNENGTSSETGTLIYNTQIIDGSFNENTFTGIFESESVRDTITVILNDNLNMVEYLKRSGVEENTAWEIYWEKGYTATDLLLNCDSQNKFEAKGLDVCNKVSEIIYNYSTPIYTTTLTDFSCEEVSSIMVEFSKK